MGTFQLLPAPLRRAAPVHVVVVVVTVLVVSSVVVVDWPELLVVVVVVVVPPGTTAVASESCGVPCSLLPMKSPVTLARRCRALRRRWSGT